MRSISTVALLLGDFSIPARLRAQVFRALRAMSTPFAPGVERGGGKIMNCLRTHKSELSEACFGPPSVTCTINRNPSAKKGSGPPADDQGGGAAGPGDAAPAAPAQ